MRTPTLIVLCSSLSLGLLLTACGEVSYKRGAGPDAFRLAQQTCRAGPLAYPDCMARQGWTQIDMAALNPGLAFTPVADNRQAAQAPAERKAQQNAPADDALVHVVSWWKFGAGPSGLGADLKRCAPDAGTAPEHAGHAITGAQLRCMGEAGWHGQLARP